MTITEPVSVDQPRRPHDDVPHVGAEIGREELVRRIRQLRTEAYLAGRRVPGRPALALATGASSYRVRQALEEIAREHPRFPESDRRVGNQASANGSPAGGAAVPGDAPTPPVSPATSQPSSRHSESDANASRRDGDERAPTGANASRPQASRPAGMQRDLPGSVARAAVLASMFVLAAAVWIKAAELSGHQIELAVLPVVDWPVRLAYFAPILVEGAVYAAIRICHTLDYARSATRRYARGTAIIGLAAMVLVGATVGLGLADEAHVRHAIGALIGGLGPYMGWRTSKASAMVVGDRRAAARNEPHVAETSTARPGPMAGMLATLTAVATARVASWGRESQSGARTPPDAGATSSAHVAHGPPGRHGATSSRPGAADAGAGAVPGGASSGGPDGAAQNGSPIQHRAGRGHSSSGRRT